jgi:hypothetical protein
MKRKTRSKAIKHKIQRRLTVGAILEVFSARFIGTLSVKTF